MKRQFSSGAGISINKISEWRKSFHENEEWLWNETIFVSSFWGKAENVESLKVGERLNAGKKKFFKCHLIMSCEKEKVFPSFNVGKLLGSLSEQI